MADKTKEQLQQELDEWTLRAAVETKKKEAYAALLSVSSVTPLDAKTEADANVQIEAQILTYRMLARAAGKVVEQVATKAGDSVLIHNAADLTALGAYRAFAGQMKELGGEYDAIAPTVVTPEAVIGAIVTVTAAVKSVIDLIALFRTQHDIKGVAVEIDELPLFSEVAGRLVAKNKSVFISQLYPFDIGESVVAAIQALVRGVRERAANAATRLADLATSDPAAHATAETRFKALEVIRTGYEDLLTKAALPDAAPFLASLLRGAAVEEKLKTASLLYLKVVKAGGANETKRNLASSRIWHSGGVIVNFVLFGKDGSVKLASTVNAYSGEVKEVPGD